ncbi:MAG: helix-turn-helix transcriptional regulator [Pseudomonadota bacterium]
MKLNFFREWRELNNVTQDVAADACGVSAATISRWEKEANGWPPIALVHLSQLYKCEPADLLRPPTSAERRQWFSMIDNMSDTDANSIKTLIQSLAHKPEA